MIKRLWPGAWCLDPVKKVWVVPEPTLFAARWLNYVLLGEQFMERLTWPEVHAVVAHELGHSWWHQFSKGVIKSLAPALLPGLTRRHELQADDYAKRQGWGDQLASALLKFEGKQTNGYPEIDERVRRLRC